LTATASKSLNQDEKDALDAIDLGEVLKEALDEDARNLCLLGKRPVRSIASTSIRIGPPSVS
jgi:hypothetical protein